MWIFNKDGFFSIVQKPNQLGTDMITVRSRNKEDLGHFLSVIGGSEEEVKKNIGTDYEFRIVVNKNVLNKYMEKAIAAIDYNNFKHEVKSVDPYRASIYLRIWATLLDLADRLTKNRSFDSGYFDSGGIWKGRRGRGASIFSSEEIFEEIFNDKKNIFYLDE